VQRTTIADVAQAAGVSKSTVSRVLSGKTKYMREETRQRVAQAIQELDYRPSSVARSLVSKRTLTAGLLVSDVGNPYYAEVIHGVEDVALANGYNIFLCNTSYNLDYCEKYVQSLMDKQVDGVLFMSSSMPAEWMLEVSRHEIPTVALGGEFQDVARVGGIISVNFDTGIRAAIDHLVELGHRRLAHVSGPLHLRTSLLRRDAFFRALAANGIDPEEAIVVEGNLRLDGGRRALAQILDMPQPPSAILAANDLTALGIVSAAYARNLQIPADLSVVGLDNIELAAQILPPLTTIALPGYEIGCLAMLMLLELLQTAQESQSQSMDRRRASSQKVGGTLAVAPPGQAQDLPLPQGIEKVRHQQVDTRLVIRQSTAPVRE
jgi:DNA-binding LacI/PurR family transcriptional regulator